MTLARVHRRQCLGTLAALAGTGLGGTGLAGLGGLLPAPARAADDAYPTRPVKLLVGYQAGGPTDLTARLLAAQLQKSLGQPFVVENRPGAGANLANETVANAAPDGYTLLLAGAPVTMNAFLYKGLKYDVQKSFEPVSLVMSVPSVLAVSPTLPVKDLQDLMALARREPGKRSYASTGVGGTPHMAAEQFRRKTGLDLLHVPYKGSASVLTDLIAGHVDMSFISALAALPHMQSGKIRPLAVAAARRLPQLPQVPTFAEAGVAGFESDSWNGLMAPAGTPPALVARLAAEVAKAVATAEMRDKIEAQGAMLVGNTPAQFKAHIEQEVTHWAALFKTLNLQPQ